MALQSTDPIADLLTRIRNAIAVDKEQIRVPTSKLKHTVANELAAAGYIESVAVETGSPRGTLVVTIRKSDQTARITAIDRLSKPGRRVYSSAATIPKVKNGRGIVLISTSQGVMTGTAAYKKQLGGELLCKVY